MAKTENEATVQNESELVTIIVPKRYKGDDRRFANVNGEEYSVATNTPVTVPRNVAAVLMQSVHQRENFEALCDNLEKTSKFV